MVNCRFALLLLIALPALAVDAFGSFSNLNNANDGATRTKRSACPFAELLECGNGPNQMPCGPEHTLVVSGSLRKVAEILERDAITGTRGYPIMPGDRLYPPFYEDYSKYPSRGLFGDGFWKSWFGKASTQAPPPMY